MSDLSSYRQQVTEYGKKATEAEKNEQWDQAYGHYMAALEVFTHLIKCRSNWNLWNSYWLFELYFIVEKNPSLKKLYTDKMGQYMSRAEYIKKTVLDKPSEPTGGSGAGAGASA